MFINCSFLIHFGIFGVLSDPINGDPMKPPNIPKDNARDEERRNVGKTQATESRSRSSPDSCTNTIVFNTLF